MVCEESERERQEKAVIRMTIGICSHSLVLDGGRQHPVSTNMVLMNAEHRRVPEQLDGEEHNRETASIVYV